jgi:hypothetical protein
MHDFSRLFSNSSLPSLLSHACVRAHGTASLIWCGQVLVAANLKPRKMAGVESNGMVFCASNDEHTIVSDGVTQARVHVPSLPLSLSVFLVVRSLTPAAKDFVLMFLA